MLNKLKFLIFNLFIVLTVFTQSKAYASDNIFAEDIKFGKFTPIGDKKFVPKLDGNIAQCNMPGDYPNHRFTANVRGFPEGSCKITSWLEVHEHSNLNSDIPAREKLYKVHSLCDSMDSLDGLPTVSQFFVGVDQDTRNLNISFYDYIDEPATIDTAAFVGLKLDEQMHACKPKLLSGVNLTDDNGFYAALSGANIRQGPGKAFLKIGTLKQREIIHAAGRAGNWIGFEKSGEIVFVWKNLLIETVSQLTDAQKAQQELIEDRHNSEEQFNLNPIED